MSAAVAVAACGPDALPPPEAGLAALLPAAAQVSLGLSPGAAFVGQDPEALAAELDLLASAGFRWIRLDVDWSVIEAAPGRFDWSDLDRAVAAARERDLDVLGLVTYTPSWARPPGSTDKHPPTDIAAFARFAGAAARRYGPQGVRYWEVWNEPNWAAFWEPGPDVTVYAELLAATAAALREVDPGVVIITGGLAPAKDRPGTSISPLVFLERLYDLGAARHFDAVGVHPYSYPASPTDATTRRWNLFQQLPDLRRLMVARGDGGKQLWLTEYGAPTSGGGRSVSETAQARLVAEGTAAAAAWAWTGPLFLYNLRDDPSGAPDDPEAHFGLLRADGTAKPAWEWLAAIPRDGLPD